MTLVQKRNRWVNASRFARSGCLKKQFVHLKGVSVSFFGNMKISAHSCHKMTLARAINLLDMKQQGSNLEYGILLDGKNFHPMGARRLKSYPKFEKI